MMRTIFKVLAVYFSFAFVFNAVGFKLGIFSVFTLFSVLALAGATMIATGIVLALLVVAILIDDGRSN